MLTSARIPISALGVRIEPDSSRSRIFEICVHHGISIEPEWVPRSNNEQADYLSRIVDFDDWSVSPHIFRFFRLEMGASLY